MQIWQAVILGFVQGLAEFLPISSSGHLILLQRLFGIKENVLFYSVMLHMGTLIPVIIVLKREISGLFHKPFYMLFYLIVATVPAGIVGLSVSYLFDPDKLFSDNIYLLGFAFIFTAIILFLSERKTGKTMLKGEFRPLDYRSALIMGLGQAVGVVPGISRSGATISAGCLASLSPSENADFTFLMSIPIILSAVIMEGGKVALSGNIGAVEIVPLLFGVVSAMVSGYISITFMMKVIKKANYKWFSLYLLALSVVTFII